MSTNKKLTPKPRDPFVQHLVKKKQGAHTKSLKAERATAKTKLRRDVFNQQ